MSTGLTLKLNPTDVKSHVQDHAEPSNHSLTPPPTTHTHTHTTTTKELRAGWKLTIMLGTQCSDSTRKIQLSSTA